MYLCNKNCLKLHIIPNAGDPFKASRSATLKYTGVEYVTGNEVKYECQKLFLSFLKDSTKMNIARATFGILRSIMSCECNFPK